MPLRGKGKSGRQNIKSFLNPNAPTIGTATNAGSGRAYNNGSATLTFTASASGAAATSFTATSSPGSYTVTGASSPLTVTGLQSNTAYTFVVKATNSVGDSSDSSASNSITATTVPQAPTIGTATKTGITTATVTYTAGATGGAAATYAVSPGSGSGASPISITGLTGSTAYTFRVTATNANGASTASSASNSVTTDAPAPLWSVGQVGPSGGRIIYDAGSSLGWGRYIEMANGGYSSGAALAGTYSAPMSPAWADEPMTGYAATTNGSAGSSATSIGSGYSNTVACVNQNNSGGPARARNYTGGGSTNWHVPSRDELSIVFNTRGSTDIWQGAGYWSSTETSATYANLQNMNTGAQGNNPKSNGAMFRAIRYIPA